MYCGNKFLVKDELVRIAVEHSGSVEVSRKQEADNYAELAKREINCYITIMNNEINEPNKLNYGLLVIREKLEYELYQEYRKKISDIDCNHKALIELVTLHLEVKKLIELGKNIAKENAAKAEKADKADTRKTRLISLIVILIVFGVLILYEVMRILFS